MRKYKYEKIYNLIVNKINSLELGYGQKIPSIRKLAIDLDVSKTTVENAYNQLLVEGYIASKNKSGYYVAIKPDPFKSYKLDEIDTSLKEKSYKYDFSGSKVDNQIFRLDLWRKYLNRIINDNNNLISYGNSSGEEVLKKALSSYSFKYRGVQCSYQDIYVGSGFQVLLQLICTLFSGDTVVGIEKNGFSQAIQVFKDNHLEIAYLDVDQEGIMISSLKKNNVKLLYLNSASGGYKGGIIRQQRRLELIRYAYDHNIFIIEDDHNGELKYLSKPVDAMAKLDNNHIIYLGSFSKLLLPSLRIAYAIIPNSLKKEMEYKSNQYHQTVSKIEQLAFAQYLNDNEFERHIKRLRNLYLKKVKILLKALDKYLPNYKYQLYETALRIDIEIQPYLIDNYFDKAKKEDILLIKNSNQTIGISFSGISLNEIEPAIQLLSKIW